MDIKEKIKDIQGTTSTTVDQITEITQVINENVNQSSSVSAEISKLSEKRKHTVDQFKI